MTAVSLVHEDGSVCFHDGPPQATLTDEGGPRCAAGQPVTHILIGANILTVEEAAVAVKGIADAFTAMFTLIIAELTRFVSELGAALEPQMRILAAAAAAWENERTAELGEDGGIPWKDTYQACFPKDPDDE